MADEQEIKFVSQAVVHELQAKGFKISDQDVVDILAAVVTRIVKENSAQERKSN